MPVTKVTVPQNCYPKSGLRGATLKVRITGDSLTPSRGVSFGKGVVVQDFQDAAKNVVDADIYIKPDAVPSARDVIVVGPEAPGQLLKGFTVV